MAWPYGIHHSWLNITMASRDARRSGWLMISSSTVRSSEPMGTRLRDISALGTRARMPRNTVFRL